jgi:phosphate transporter
VVLYAKCVTYSDEKTAKAQLKLYQRENIAWERDTVWRQMIGRERRGESGEADGDLMAAPIVVGKKSTELWSIQTPLGRFKITRKKIWLVVAVVLFAILLNVQSVKGVEANRCFAILIFCTVLWATEVSNPASLLYEFYCSVLNIFQLTFFARRPCRSS